MTIMFYLFMYLLINQLNNLFIYLFIYHSTNKVITLYFGQEQQVSHEHWQVPEHVHLVRR